MGDEMRVRRGRPRGHRARDVGGRLVRLPRARGREGRLDLRPHGDQVAADQSQVVDHLAQELDDRQLGKGTFHEVGPRCVRRRHADDLLGVSRDGDVQVDVDPIGSDPVRVHADVVRAPAELLDPDRAYGHPVSLPAKEADLAPGEHAFGRLDVLQGRLDGQEGRDLHVGKEAEERLRPGVHVVALHAEVLQRGQRIHHDARVRLALDLHAEHLFEAGDRDLDAAQFRRLADLEVDPVERNRGSDRRDVLERSPLVAHHVGDRVEDVHLPEVWQEGAVVPAGFVGRLLERDQ